MTQLFISCHRQVEEQNVVNKNEHNPKKVEFGDTLETDSRLS